MIPNCTYPYSEKCNTYGLQCHIAPACARCQNSKAISSSSLPAPNASPAQLAIAYDGGLNFPLDGGTSAWQLPSLSASTVSASTRAGAFFLPSHRPTPEMPLRLGPPNACGRGLLVSCMPDTGASQSVVSADVARDANLSIRPTNPELCNASNAVMTLVGEANIIMCNPVRRVSLC